MVIEETQTTLTPEIVTVSDLIGKPAAAEAVPIPSGSPNIDKLEQWIRILDKGLSIADRGITILGKADSIVRNISEVIMSNKNQQQQQQQPQQVLYQVQQQPQPMPAAVEHVADAEDQQVRPTSAEAVPAQNDLGQHDDLGQHGNLGQLVTAERISGVLSMLLNQCPDMTVKELKDLIDRNPNFINSILSFLK